MSVSLTHCMAQPLAHILQAFIRHLQSRLLCYGGCSYGSVAAAVPLYHDLCLVCFGAATRCGLRDTSNLPSTQCQAKLDLLLDMFREDIGRIDFTESWRPFTSLNADGAVSGSSCSKLQKLLTALRYHLTRADKAGVEDFLHQLCVKLQVNTSVHPTVC